MSSNRGQWETRCPCACVPPQGPWDWDGHACRMVAFPWAFVVFTVNSSSALAFHFPMISFDFLVSFKNKSSTTETSSVSGKAAVFQQEGKSKGLIREGLWLTPSVPSPENRSSDERSQGSSSSLHPDVGSSRTSPLAHSVFACICDINAILYSAVLCRVLSAQKFLEACTRPESPWACLHTSSRA